MNAVANKNNWRRTPINACRCGCGVLVAKEFKKGHGRRRPVLHRIAVKLEQRGDCWIWGGAVDAGGYGRVGIGDSRTDLVHRVVFAALVEPIPYGLHIDHMCRARLCCNPSHLDAVTQAENNRRERLSADEHFALAGLVVAKRRGLTDPLEQVVFMTMRDLIALLTGERP